MYTVMIVISLLSATAALAAYFVLMSPTDAQLLLLGAIWAAAFARCMQGDDQKEQLGWLKEIYHVVDRMR